MNDFDEDDEPADRITCERCGTTGLHWQKVYVADGKSEKFELFNERNRKHVCAGPDTEGFDKEN